VFIVIHDNYLDDTTDVRNHPEFADRETDGKFYVYDFTLAELKTLRLHQRSSERTALYDGVFTIPTFTEILDLVQDNYESSGGWMVGVYPELKRPSSTNDMFNISMEAMVLDVLQSYGYETTGVSQDLNLVQPVVLQSFEEESLRKLQKMTDIPLLQLWHSGDAWPSEDSLDNIATYAQGFGPAKHNFDDAGVDLTAGRKRVKMVLNRGLFLHPYVFKESTDKRFNNDTSVEAAYFYCCLGVDATFTEFPDFMREIIEDIVINKDAICALGGC
jgi:glycerophosphoryl diester phosphodiesterase